MSFQSIVTEWLKWGWPAVANHLWQATLFSLIAMAVATLLKSGPARARYVIWLAASIKFALPPVLFILLLGSAGLNISSSLSLKDRTSLAVRSISPIVTTVAMPAGYLADDYALVTNAEAASASVRGNNQNLWLPIVAGLWLTGCALLLLRWFRRRQQLSTALRAGTVVSSGREWEALKKVLSWLRVRRRVELIISPMVTEPGVWRSLRPVVLLPEGIGEQLSDEELEALMMHEIVHVLRWDNLISNLQMFLCCLFWFHPVLWLIDKRLLEEREQACDEMVLKLSGASDVYASSIRKIYRFCLGWKVTGFSTASGANLRRRLERIVTESCSSNLSAAHKLLVSAVFAGVVVLSVVAGALGDDSSLAQSKFISKKIAAEFVENIIAREKDCIDASDRKCSPVATTSPSSFIKEGPRAEVIVRAGKTVEALPPPSEAATTNAPNLKNLAPVPPPEPVSETAHAVDRRKFVGRYAVDPNMMENFVFDVSLEGGELWLKPSHVTRRVLVRQSDVEYLDSKSTQTRITFNWDETGNVDSFTIKGWGPTIRVKKLVLPAPSLSGNTTFRLSGFQDARVVAVAGTFNNWNQSQYLFERVGDEWVCRINLPPGKYQYKFIVDGNWLVDPRNPKVVRDDRGIENSWLVTE